MSDAKQPNGRRPQSRFVGNGYYIVTVADPNYRIRRPGTTDTGQNQQDGTANVSEAATDTSHRIEAWSEVRPNGTYHYRVVKADISIRPARTGLPDWLRRDVPTTDTPPSPDSPAPDAPATDAGEAPAGS